MKLKGGSWRAGTCLARRKCSQTLDLLEVVTIISLIYPTEKPGAEPGKRDYWSKAERHWLVTLPKARGLELCASPAGQEFLRDRMI